MNWFSFLNNTASVNCPYLLWYGFLQYIYNIYNILEWVQTMNSWSIGSRKYNIYNICVCVYASNIKCPTNIYIDYNQLLPT